MTTVIHCRLAAGVPAADYVYCGRPSMWGNPYAIGGSYGTWRRITRAQAIELFERYWYSDLNKPMRAHALVALRDKVLGCWCHPKPCHVDVIAEFVNRCS